jgi:hypothetical protein
VHDVGVLALRGLAGGSLVVAFALVGEVLRPKAFSGLFSSAPSVAVASLAITVGFESVRKAGEASTGMVLGGLAMTACCVSATVLIPHVRALRGSVAAWLTWGAVALGLYWAVFVGAR